MPKTGRLRALAVGAALASLVGMFSMEYTVERGDTLGKIARQHGVGVNELVEANGIVNPNLIRVGQILVIPGDEGQADMIHVVVRGDTLGRIARQYGTSVTLLVGTNQLPNPNLIRVGQEILIPGRLDVGTGEATKEPADDTAGSDSENPAAEETPTTEPAYDNVRSGLYHVVKRGEKLGGIAALYSGVTAEQIARANGILNGVVYANTRLFLDGPDFVATGIQGQGTYTVRSGDRLGDIAAAHGTTISRLAEDNGIANPNLIRSGQVLVVPGGSSWVCPVEDARFFNDWGFPRGGGERYHEGNDLFSSFGAPVHAPVSGVVDFKTGSIGGFQFNLHGDDGVEYVGSHMSEFGKEGRVAPGDVVGFIGTSGSAAGTNPHLHFGMYLKGGVVVNPYPTLIANSCK